MNPIFCPSTVNPSQHTTPQLPVDPTTTTDRNAQRDAHTRQLFIRLRALDKSEAPADVRAAQSLVQEIALYCDRLCSTAARELLKKRSGQKVNTQDIEDLIQEARLGLIKAIARFDPDRGVSFASFAFPIITGEMRHYLRDRASLIRESSYSQERRFQKKGEAPAVAHCAGLPGQAHECLAIEKSYNGVNHDFQGELMRGIEPDFAGKVEERLSLQSEIENLKDCPDHLSAARGRAVELHLGGATLEAIGKELGCSIFNARALLAIGIAAIRAALEI